MFKKCILILAASCMMYSCATQTESNPFLTEFQTPNGVPPFDKIKLEHYEPAFQKGIEEQNANIQAIIDNTEAPTFENVIVALDNSSPTLDRVGGVFFNLTEAETTDELTALSMKLAPTLAEHEDNISLNQELFKKVDAVYSQKDALGQTRYHKSCKNQTHFSFHLFSSILFDILFITVFAFHLYGKKNKKKWKNENLNRLSFFQFFFYIYFNFF